jgi:hypothetical protein
MLIGLEIANSPGSDDPFRIAFPGPKFHDGCSCQVRKIGLNRDGPRCWP